jgi:hypothetical protein
MKATGGHHLLAPAAMPVKDWQLVPKESYGGKNHKRRRTEHLENLRCHLEDLMSLRRSPTPLWRSEAPVNKKAGVAKYP